VRGVCMTSDVARRLVGYLGVALTQRSLVVRTACLSTAVYVNLVWPITNVLSELISQMIDVLFGLDYAEQPVKIVIADVNDELPEFKNVPRPFLTTVSANAAAGTSVYQLMAQDADENSIVRYKLESGTWHFYGKKILL
jgi:hypothetical protein